MLKCVAPIEVKGTEHIQELLIEFIIGLTRQSESTGEIFLCVFGTTQTTPFEMDPSPINFFCAVFH